MSQDISFNAVRHELPDGEALTGPEIEARMLKSLEESEGKSMEALWNLAALYQQTGRLDEAMECLEKIIPLTQDPELLGTCWLALGQIEESRGDYSAAERRYRSALAFEPTFGDTWYLIHNNLGYSLNQLGRYQEAVPYLQQAAKMDPARPNAFKNLGLSCVALGLQAQAAELFIQATQVNAADSRSLALLESLVGMNPELADEVPDLQKRLEACRKAVAKVKAEQPDFDAHWNQLRQKQSKRWWQFWK